MQADPDHKTSRIVALDEEQLELMAHDHHELYLKSEGCQVSDNKSDNKNSMAYKICTNRCSSKHIDMF